MTGTDNMDLLAALANMTIRRLTALVGILTAAIFALAAFGLRYRR